MTPQTDDAYIGSLRDIVSRGYLQPPIFDLNADPAINYGAAGGVIGHELTLASTTKVARPSGKVARLVDGKGRGDL